MTTSTTSVTRRIFTPAIASAQATTALKLGEHYREFLSITHSTLSKIFSLKENDPERLMLQEKLDLNSLIIALEESLGIHSQNNSHSISSKPILISGLGKDYARQWKLIIKALLVLSKLHELRFYENENLYDKSKVAFNLEYSKLMTFFYEGNPDLKSTATSSIKSRLSYFSKQRHIGRERFATDVQRGRNLLALSSWLAGEFCKNIHPIPGTQIIEPAKRIETPASLASRSKLQHKQREFDFNPSE